MITKIIKFLNNLDKFPFYTISLLPYSFGNSLEQIKFGSVVAKKRNKSLIFITATIAPKFLKYKNASKFLLSEVSISKKSIIYIFFKKFFEILLNLEFFFKRLYFLYYEKKIKNIQEFDFPYLGLEDFYTKKTIVRFNEIEKFDDLKLSLIIPKKFDKKSSDLLNKIGVKKNSKMVCIHVRDARYHNDLGRRDFRNPNIENYYESIHYLLNKGYSVIRLGVVAEKKYEIYHDNLFDLPFILDPKEIEYLQFYVVKHCSFFIAHDSGPQYIPWFYGKPTLFTNILRPFGLNSPGINCRYTTRQFYDLKNNKLLSLNEYLKLPFKYHETKFIDDSIRFIENSSEDLLNSLVEFENNYIKNSWDLSETQIRYNQNLKIRLEEMLDYEGEDENEFLQKMKYKVLFTKNCKSNKGSVTNYILSKNFV